MKFKILLCLLLLLMGIFFLTYESDDARLAKIEKECTARNTIQELSISFFGYFPKDADSIDIKIKRGNTIIKEYTDKIPDKIADSLRHQRYYSIKDEILITDTLFLKIKNEPVKKIYGFQYTVVPHYTMMNKNWGCELGKLTINGKENEGAYIDFTRKNFTMPERKDFKDYYQ